ncbi:hypothetical protein D3OALGB2SA_4463 [Olavius algarvensis associated proteobacterium Delta 3]|nr:hypothetical protein D3OALGB2SA_4463 [Olavius algarvensis associated proteobacterium Delta 3]
MANRLPMGYNKIVERFYETRRCRIEGEKIIILPLPPR